MTAGDAGRRRAIASRDALAHADGHLAGDAPDHAVADAHAISGTAFGTLPSPWRETWIL